MINNYSFKYEFTLCICVCACNGLPCIQGVFPSHNQCSQDILQTHHDSDHDTEQITRTFRNSIAWCKSCICIKLLNLCTLDFQCIMGKNSWASYCKQVGESDVTESLATRLRNESINELYMCCKSVCAINMNYTSINLQLWEIKWLTSGKGWENNS